MCWFCVARKTAGHPRSRGTGPEPAVPAWPSRERFSAVRASCDLPDSSQLIMEEQLMPDPHSIGHRRRRAMTTLTASSQLTDGCDVARRATIDQRSRQSKVERPLSLHLVSTRPAPATQRPKLLSGEHWHHRTRREVSIHERDGQAGRAVRRRRATGRSAAMPPRRHTWHHCWRLHPAPLLGPCGAALYGTSGNVFVYPLQAQRRCEYGSALPAASPRRTGSLLKIFSLIDIYRFDIRMR